MITQKNSGSSRPRSCIETGATSFMLMECLVITHQMPSIEIASRALRFRASVVGMV